MRAHGTATVDSMFRSLAAPLAVLGLLAAPAAAGAVVGGGPASPGAFPHIGSLSVDGDFVCGASLLTPQWALTAAHCVVDGGGAGERAAVDPGRVSVGLGSPRRSEPAEVLRGAEVVVHPSYGSPAANSNDVALIRLAGASSRATPIRLAAPAEGEIWAPGDETVAIGWGTAFFPDVVGLTIREDLQEIRVPRRADAECAESYPSDFLVGRFEPSSMLCAGNRGGGEDSCQGDSGGPLMAFDAQGRLAQVGVVSFGFGCGLGNQYGVYARVAANPLYDWIVGRTGPTGPPAPPAPAAPSGAGASAEPTVRVRHAHVGRKRLGFGLSTTAPLRDVSISVTRRIDGRTVSVARHRAETFSGSARVAPRLRVRPATARALLRVTIRATDESGRRFTQVRRTRARTHSR